MFVSAITAEGFRNLEGRIPLSDPLAILIGENNTGKSNVLDALRLLFQPEAGPRARLWVTEQDFRHDGRGVRISDAFELEVELSDLSNSDEVRMVTCLAPSLGQHKARLRLRAHIRADGRLDVEWFGGDSQHPDVERWAREAIGYTYLPPLRDAAADLRPGRENRLVGLLQALAPPGHLDREQVESILATANSALNEVPSMTSAKEEIQGRLRGMTGSGAFAQHTNLVFADPQFDRIVATLRAMAGALEPLELSENGLGYNNLLYMAVLLAGLSRSSEQALHVLLVEEPEAHLHPQLQDLLMRYLEAAGGNNTQVVVTSHSPNFASAGRVDRATVMVARGPAEPTIARAPSLFGLSVKQLAYLRRFLDVTKAALLFARGVILVEGVAEQLLVPAIARKIGRPLQRDGVAVINVGGVTFEPFIELFGEERLPYRCAVVSDGDPSQAPSSEELEGGEVGLSPRASALRERTLENVQVSLATRTLEWDLALTGNWAIMVRALRATKPRVAEALETELAEATNEVRAARLLEKIADVKGPFAQELADLIESEEGEFNVPDYLRTAIEWVTVPGA